MRKWDETEVCSLRFVSFYNFFVVAFSKKHYINIRISILSERVRKRFSRTHPTLTVTPCDIGLGSQTHALIISFQATIPEEKKFSRNENSLHLPLVRFSFQALWIHGGTLIEVYNKCSCSKHRQFKESIAPQQQNYSRLVRKERYKKKIGNILKALV